MLSKHIAFRCLRQFFWRKLNEMFILFADGGGALTLIYKQSDRDEKRENRASGGEGHRKTLEMQRFLCDLCLTLDGICYIIIKRL